MKSMVTGPLVRRRNRFVLRWLITLGVASAVSITSLTLVASASAAAAQSSLATDVGGGHLVAHATPVAQAPLTLTSISGTVGTALTLTSSGGSGTGAVTYAITSSGTASCLISGGELDATHAGTCAVTVTKAADATYLAASSPATTVTFAPAPPKAQATLTLASTKGTVGTTLTLTSSGGSGTGAVTYAITSSGTASCLISVNKLSATHAGTCAVTVTKAADAAYLAASSPATTVTFAPAPLKTQSVLTLTSTTGTAGTALTLTSKGGSGSGAVAYAVSSTGTAACWITSNKLYATRAGTCTVTVTKAADATYLLTRSLATTVTFVVAPPTLSATKVNGIVWVGRTVNVSIIGTGFYSKPTIKSNEARTSAIVTHDYGRQLVVRVTLPSGSAQGWHVFTIVLANGQSCKVRYLVK